MTAVPAPSSEAITDPPVLFDAVLRPHRSLSRRGFAIVMAGLAAISFAAGICFAALGAWPVFGFFGLDLALVYLAFRLNYRAARHYERVRLTERELSIARGGPRGEVAAQAFQPHWVRVELDDPPEDRGQLRLTSHGRSVTVGAFLAPDERRDFAQALTAELDRLRRPVFNA